jgi:hypothetical protein
MLQLKKYYNIRFVKLVSKPPWITLLKNAGSALDFYGKNFVHALQHLFPELGIDETKFKRMPRGYWVDIKRQRELFFTFAKLQGFDPLIADNWYNVDTEKLYSFKGVSSVLPHYNGSVRKALVTIFPDISLELRKFLKADKYWSDVNNQKKVFLMYAEQHGFDPLIAQNWYSIPLNTVAEFKGAQSFLIYYGGSVTKALAHIFPSIDTNLFVRKKPNKYWQNTKNQRKVLVDYAFSQGFNPLEPLGWQCASKNILAFPGARAVLEQYNSRLQDALVTLFPS